MTPRPTTQTPHVTSMPFAEDLVFTLLSAAVVFVMVSTLLLQPVATLAISAKPQGPGPNKQFTVLYGTVRDASGVPVANATIQILDSTGRLVVEGTSAADGTFRIRFREVTAPYTVRITATYAGQTVTGSTTMMMQAGFTYGIAATVNAATSFLWVALPIY